MFLSSSLRSGRVVALVFGLCVLAALVFYQTPHPPSRWSTSTPPPPPTQAPPQSSLEDHESLPGTPEPGRTHPPASPVLDIDPRCASHPDPGNLAIAVKTGATEAIEKIPLLMLTTMQCAKNVMIFSDLEQDIAGHHLYDSLSDIPHSAMQGNSDFDFYFHLKEAQKLGEIEAMLRGARDPRMPQDLAAWTLDKYKQLHILEKLYAAHPDKDWYMMIDADTYLVWSNVITWLSKLPDPRTNKLYLGSPATVGDVNFAHGGSGIFISHAAMYEFAVVNKGLAAKWDKPIHDECCGDYIIGKELKNAGIILKASWPTVNGEKPVTLPFGPTHWCQPVVTMHHVAPNEMSQLANFELSRNNTKTPMTFADLFHAFTGNVVPNSLEDWDNFSRDSLLELDSYAACQKQCEDDDSCFQFAHQGKECYLGHSIHLGEPKGSDPGMKRQSGWLKQRIETWVKKQPPCQPVFPHTE